MNDNQNPNGVPGPLPEATAKTQGEWREYCAQLLAQIEQLRTENGELREEKRAFASMIPVPEEVKRLAELPPEQLLAMAEMEPALEELIMRLLARNARAIVINCFSPALTLAPSSSSTVS